MNKYAAICIVTMMLAGIFSLKSAAQSSTVSPYSQFGLGHLSEQTSGINRGMDGLGIGVREHNQVNPLNPASYSSIDSLTFIFDAGISGQITNFEQDFAVGSQKLNAKTASLDYAIAGFRIIKNLGMSFGILPYTNVGYNYYTEDKKIIDGTNVLFRTTYAGEEGGLHQFFIGAGWQPIKNLSVGLNAAYLGGSINRSVTLASSDANIPTSIKSYSTTISSYKLDLGLQYELSINKKDNLTVGLTYGVGHKLGADQTMQYSSVTQTTTSTNSTNSTTESQTPVVAENAFAIPHSFGVGVYWKHNNQWKVGMDYSLQKWGSIKYPVLVTNDNNLSFKMSDEYYKNRSKLTLGGEYCKNELSKKFLQRVRYRMGASYTSPYYKLGNVDGPKELSISAGFGIPIINGYNNRSILNVSAQWVNAEAKGFIKENTFRINIGLTFNERWFMKWKLD